MIRWFIFAILFFSFFTICTNIVYAFTLSCFDVDGMAIFGYKYGEWKFIGAIANEFDSDSIANEFGAGNEFSSDSIFNEFGSFGSEFSSYSAFNEFASNPPIIVNDYYKFVGYLTINEFKTPNINTYQAIACAKKSFRSFSNYDLENITFKNIPNSSGYGDYPGVSQQEIENLLKALCPPNSQFLNGQCVCNEGYVASGSICITYTQNCQLKYGLNSYGDKNYCYCSAGYEFNAIKTSCVKAEAPKQQVFPPTKEENQQQQEQQKQQAQQIQSKIKELVTETKQDKSDEIKAEGDNQDNENEQQKKGILESVSGLLARVYNAFKNLFSRIFNLF